MVSYHVWKALLKWIANRNSICQVVHSSYWWNSLRQLHNTLDASFMHLYIPNNKTLHLTWLVNITDTAFSIRTCLRDGCFSSMSTKLNLKPFPAIQVASYTHVGVCSLWLIIVFPRVLFISMAKYTVCDHVPGKQVLILVIKMLTGNYESSDKTDLAVLESVDTSQIDSLQFLNSKVSCFKGEEIVWKY